MVTPLYPLPSLLPFPSPPAPKLLSLIMVYIPFTSLLGIQAMLGSFAPKQPMLEDADAFTPVHFIIPKPGGGSFLDRTVNGLGEPLNVKLSSLPVGQPQTNDEKNRLSFRRPARHGSSRTAVLCTLQTPSDCDRNRSHSSHLPSSR